MFVTKNQLYVFIACLAFGGGVGGVFSLFSIIFGCAKNKLIKALPFVLISIPLGIAYVFYGYMLKFPNFRLYMIAGVFCGIYLYFKSFHIILAKFVKKFYNIIHNSKKESRKCQKQKQKD